ncbi:MAG TPA: hypothetical protein VFS43_23730 [Polyangiaceae bacterium]|nr:hypothetical protein [Polyangiaceae bacterium]
MEGTKMKILWMITERGERTFWTRIGVGYVNRDGSVNLTLDALPLGTNRLQLRDYTVRDAEAGETPPEGYVPDGVARPKPRRAPEDRP